MEQTKYEEICHKLDFIAKAYTLLHNEMIRIRLPEEDYVINTITTLLQQIMKIAHKFENETKVRETFRMPDEFVELIGTMKFIAKRMDLIEKRFNELEGLDFKHKLKITVDTSELDIYNTRDKMDDPYKNLFSRMPKSYAQALSWHYGIYGEKETKANIARRLVASRQRVITILRQAIKRCRQPEFEEIVIALPDGELKKAIMGKE